MPMIIDMYIHIEPKRHRIPCPIHNGKDYNFWFNDTIFKCFVCGASGDVIKFVELYFNLNFSDACKKLNADFNLGLYEKVKYSEYRKLKQTEQKRNKQKRIEAEHKAKYWGLFSEWVILDYEIKSKPKSLVEASTYGNKIARKQYIEYVLDTWEEINEFKK